MTYSTSTFPGTLDSVLDDVSGLHFREYVKLLADAVYAIEAFLDGGGGGGSTNTILYGTAAPTTEGVDGDFYIRLVGGVPTTIYGPKSGGVWPSGAPLQGPAGADGTDGADGADGADGNTILYGTAAPTTEGVDGDFYIRLVGGVPTTIYGPKASGTWPSGSGLQGPTGATGPAGADATAIYGDPVTIAHGGTGQTTAAAALSALGGAPLASPTFTGDPKAPTPTAGDNDTSVATTAFVQNALASYIAKALVTTKGDSIVATGNATVAREAVGSNGQFIVADSTQTTGRQWRALARGDLPALPKVTVSDAAATISTGTSPQTTVGTTATESEDTHGYHSDVTNRSRLTVPTGYAGLHLVFVRGTWASNATGNRRVNYAVNGGTDVTMYLIGANPSGVTALAALALVSLSDGDYVEVTVQQTSGGNLSFTLTEFTLIRLGSV